MNWIELALNKESSDFIGMCKRRLHSNPIRMDYGYKNLSNRNMENFTNEFIKTLKYPNLKVFNDNINNSIVHEYNMSLKHKKLRLVMRKLKHTLMKYEDKEFTLTGIYVTSKDNIVIYLYTKDGIY